MFLIISMISDSYYYTLLQFLTAFLYCLSFICSIASCADAFTLGSSMMAGLFW